MKQRLLSALVGLVILFCALALVDTIFFNFMIAAISALGVFEMLNATRTLEFRALSAMAVTFAFLLPFADEQTLRTKLPSFAFVWMILFFLLLLKNHARIRVEQAALIFLTSLWLPLSFVSAVYMGEGNGVVARLYLLWALGSAWLCDTGAYFCGRAFGKHKLAPVISPKKTVEGAVGGAITAVVFMLLFALAYDQLSPLLFGVRLRVNYMAIALVTPFFAVLGMLGDLSASVIKRQYGVKDYGHIMPGHGGILDRFDSVLFTLPSVYIFVQYFPVAILLGG